MVRSPRRLVRRHRFGLRDRALTASLFDPARLRASKHDRPLALADRASARRLDVVDALRGVAILAVFAQHLGDRFMPFVRREAATALPAPLVPWVLTVLHHAWCGVDLFFVISGFSLGLSWLATVERTGRSPRATSFWARRARRILPAFFLAVAVHLAAHPEVLSRAGAWLCILSHALLLQGYWTPGGIVLIGAAWSLTTEACFYLVMPLVASRLLLGPWRTRLLVAAALCGFAWGSRALMHHLVLEPGVHTGLLEATQRRWFTSRLDQFVLGLVAASAHVDLARSALADRAVRLAPFAALACVASLVVAFRLEGALYLERGGSWPYALMSLAIAGLVLAAAQAHGTFARVIAPVPLRAIGVVSYGVFLYHQLALGVVSARLVPGEPAWGTLGATAGAALAASLAAGAASWFWIERPMLRAPVRSRAPRNPPDVPK